LEGWLPLIVTIGALMVALVVMITFWRLVIGVLSESSKWPELARRFPVSARPEGRLFARQSGALYGVAHKGILRVIPSAAGFFVEVERPFANRESALLIPWSAFRELKEQRGLFGWRHAELVMSEEVVFYLSRRAGEAVRQYFRGPRPTA